MQALQDGASAPPVLATVMALPVLTSPKTLPPLSFRSWSESRRIWWRVRRMQRRHVRAAAADVAITLSSRQSAGDGAATDQARAAQSAPYPALVSGSAKSLDEVERWLRRAQAEVTPTATPQRVAAPAAPPTPLAPDTVVSRTTLQNGVFIDELFGPPPAESLVVGDVTNLETAFSSVALQERARRQEEETRIAAEYGAQRGGSDFGISGEQMNFQAPDIGPGRRFAYKRAAAVAKSGGRGKRPAEETVFARVAGRYVTAAELVDECEIMLSESSDSDEAQDDGETEVEDQESDWKLEALAVLAGQEVRVRIQCGGVQLVRRAQASSRRRRCTELVASPSQRILRLDHDQIWKEWFKTPFAQQLKSCLQQLNSKKPEGTRDPLLAPAALADGGIVMVCLIPGKMFPQELRPKLPMPADDSGVVCDVCSEGPPGLLSCCECGIHVHASCYGIDLPVDDSEWTCDLCAAYQAGLLGAGQTPACTACIHCPHRGGAMKRAVGLSAVAEQEPASTWIHAFCAVRHEDYVFKYPSRYDLVPGGDWIAEMRAYVRPRIISALENAQRFDADMDELPFARFDPERSVVILSDAADRAWDATYGNGESTRAGLCAICGETPNVLQRQWHLPCLTRCAAHGCRVWFHASCGQLKGWGTGFAMKREGSAAVPVPVSFCPAHCRAADGAMQAEELVDQYDNVGGWLRNIDEKLNGAPNSMRSSYLNRALPEEVKERGRAIAAQRAREGKAKERRRESASWTSLSLDSPRDHRGSAHRKPKRPPAGGRQKRKRPRVVLQSDDEEEETPPPPAKAPPKLPTPGDIASQQAYLHELEEAADDGAETGPLCVLCYGPLPEEEDRNEAETAHTRQRKAESKAAVRTACCRVLLHRACLQQMADNAGSSFRCPCCNNKEAFIQDMRRVGLVMHAGNVSWKDHDDALMASRVSCVASVCNCPYGREYREERTQRDGQPQSSRNAAESGTPSAADAASSPEPSRRGGSSDALSRRMAAKVEAYPRYYLFTCFFCGHCGVHKCCLTEHLEEGNTWVCQNCKDFRARKGAVGSGPSAAAVEG